jgi:hypothetical protein
MSWINPNHDAIASKSKQEAEKQLPPFELTDEIKQKVSLDNALNIRANEYPSIGDQLDMIYHAGLGGDEFQTTIKAVKDANPKPTI